MSPGEPYWLRDGLVAYYPFDGDAKDYSGNENDGEVRNNHSFETDSNLQKEYLKLKGNGSTFSSWISSTVTPVDESLRSLDTIFADITCIVSLLASFWILCYRLPLRVCPKQRETMLLGKFFFRITC